MEACLRFFSFLRSGVEQTDVYTVASTECRLYTLRRTCSDADLTRARQMCRARLVRKRRVVWREHFCRKLPEARGLPLAGGKQFISLTRSRARANSFPEHEGFRRISGIVLTVQLPAASSKDPRRGARREPRVRKRNFFLYARLLFFLLPFVSRPDFFHRPARYRRYITDSPL